MILQPVKSYKKPVYPDKQKVMENPEILKTLPERWKGNLYVGITVSSLLFMTLTGCGQKAMLDQVVAKAASPTASPETKSKAPQYPPLFQHGDGRGSFGCMSIAPPAFLSEEEAFQVVYEEAKSQGIEFDKNGRKFLNVQLPVTNIYPDWSTEGNQHSSQMKTKKGILEADGYNKKNNIAFEFVSTGDIRKWHQDNGVMSSVEAYDLITTAETLRKGIQGKTGKTTVGVFYDPSPSLTEKEIQDQKMTWQEKEKKLKDQATEELREQVKDFINWLKAQGII